MHFPPERDWRHQHRSGVLQPGRLEPGVPANWTPDLTSHLSFTAARSSTQER